MHYAALMTEKIDVRIQHCYFFRPPILILNKNIQLVTKGNATPVSSGELLGRHHQKMLDEQYDGIFAGYINGNFNSMLGKEAFNFINLDVHSYKERK